MANNTGPTEPSSAGKRLSPPPAPPLPPTPSTSFQEPSNALKGSPSNLTDGTSSKSSAARAAMAARFAAVDRADASRREIPETEQTFNPCHMFFYGSLMDAQVLQTVAKLADPPTTRRGLVKGFKIKMWGIYPTVVPDKHGVVAGTVWHTDDPSHLTRLQEYETGAYRLCDCDIELEGGQRLLGSKMFCWAGEADSPELEDGVFDFERYQKHFKPSIVSAGLS